MPHGKDKMKNNFNLVATAAAGLESLTARELRDLGHVFYFLEPKKRLPQQISG
jgi:hypothetical protein